jgi:hypothetical protein
MIVGFFIVLVLCFVSLGIGALLSRVNDPLASDCRDYMCERLGHCKRKGTDSECQ